MKRVLALGFCAVIVMASALPAVAGTGDEIRNWAAPMSWTSPTAQATGRSGLIAGYAPLPFMPLTPCRLVDTRAGSGFPAGYGPPSMAGGGTQRTFVFTGQCGISATAQAVSMNLTVWGPLSRADARVFPAGGATPTVSTLNWEGGILALANAAVVPIGAGGGITVQIDGVDPVDIFIDVNGYYSATTTTGSFSITNASGTAILGQSTSGGIGVYGYSTGAGGWGVFGTNDSATGYGVYGFSSGPAIGVYGSSSTNVGAKGKSTSYNGVWAESTNQDGLFATGGRDGAFITGVRYGVYAASTGTTGFGVLGVSANTVNDSAGIMGRDGSTLPVISNLIGSAGTRGEGGNYGVVGVAGPTGWGVTGLSVSAGGGLQQFGKLGVGTTYGVFANGNMGATGTKPFVEPHPTDPTKVIRYVAMEGPEAGTYFRAKASVSKGIAEIDVPESFRIVSDEEGLTVHVTPVGRAQTWIESSDLNRIVVGASRDVTVNVIVYGVRRAYKDWQVVADNSEYVPMSATATLPSFYSADARKRLIDNGTYNPDGTVNMHTAERAGWVKIWKDQEQVKAPPRN